MSEYIIKLPNGGAADECIRLRGYEKSLYGYELHEEIVRCRDCIGLVETWDGWECERFSGEYHRAEPKGFCAWAERRDA